MSSPARTPTPPAPDDPLERDPRRRGRVEDELVGELERDQYVAATSRPVARAPLGRYAAATLWALRVFVLVVGAMVTYTFIDQLH
ncbi:MAG TPA: hypothetical protein VGX51_12920 [Solirubrobacteraceae bacterium]|jgi:hypothetical protein|nr:hypothetical protein [Solirubrobacteraceae bacterium]